MRLRDLEAELLQIDRASDAKGSHWRTDCALADADGIIFLCPKCFAANGNQRPGVHSIICWFRGKVNDDQKPGPGRWTPAGTGIDDLTFVPGDPPMATSVLLTGEGCGWHGFVNGGDAT